MLFDLQLLSRCEICSVIPGIVTKYPRTYLLTWLSQGPNSNIFIPFSYERVISFICLRWLIISQAFSGNSSVWPPCESGGKDGKDPSGLMEKGRCWCALPLVLGKMARIKVWTKKCPCQVVTTKKSNKCCLLGGLHREPERNMLRIPIEWKLPKSRKSIFLYPSAPPSSENMKGIQQTFVNWINESMND